MVARRNFGTLAILSALMSFEEPVHGLTNLVPIAPAAVGGSAYFGSVSTADKCDD